MEQWDIYDENKQKTGRTMNRNDWHMKPDEFHLTVLGVLQRPSGRPAGGKFPAAVSVPERTEPMP